MDAIVQLAPLRDDAAHLGFADWTVQGHKVTRFDYLPGFAPHGVDDYDPHLDPTHGRGR